MKVAIIGSRNINLDVVLDFIPEQIISGGAKGIDQKAKEYALKNNIDYLEIKPNYLKYPSKVAPLKRNEVIVNIADLIIAYWDGKSKGTKYVIDYCKKIGKELKINMV